MFPILFRTTFWLSRLIQRDRRGVTALEYGLIAALIGVAIITAVTSLGTGLTTTFGKITSALPAA